VALPYSTVQMPVLMGGLYDRRGLLQQKAKTTFYAPPASEFHDGILLFPADTALDRGADSIRIPSSIYFTHLRFLNDPCVDNIRYNN
jgi:hypothetical protein